ncbi:hypothetical protein HN777_04895 [Candidatus Woesearchaeota archaeon]|jgi:hypothetical protein|nr:hypothetical protein [Candidatus Woesearchaeota archaeon]MBT7403098.1 hypothetical protein [Candidatus Woesearchaeota archaeon]
MGAIHGACAGAASSSRNGSSNYHSNEHSGNAWWNRGSGIGGYEPYTFQFVFLPPLLKNHSLENIVKNIDKHLDSSFMQITTQDELKEKREQLYNENLNYFSNLKDKVDEAGKKLRWTILINKKNKDKISEAYKQIFGFNEIPKKRLRYVMMIIQGKYDPFYEQACIQEFHSTGDGHSVPNNIYTIERSLNHIKKSLSTIDISPNYIYVRNNGYGSKNRDDGILFGQLFGKFIGKAVIPICYWTRKFEDYHRISMKNLRKGPREIYT